MGDFFVALKDTPIPTILVVAGIVFLLLSIAGQLAGRINVPPERQRQAAIIGGLLLVVGVVLHVAPPKFFDGPPVPPFTPRSDTKPGLPPPRPSGQEIPTKEPVRRYAPPTEKCCQYDFRASRKGWCRPWGSTPRGSDNPAELGSSCYCQDQPGVVVHDCP